MERPTRDDSYILVVDDNEELCQTLSRLLRRHNFATRSVGDGDIALSCILERPLAMILDHQMQRVDGISLLARMRDLGMRLPVIMLTAYPAISDAVRAIKLGAFDYLSKPFNHDELLRMLARLIGNPPGEMAGQCNSGVAPWRSCFTRWGRALRCRSRRPRWRGWREPISAF